MIFEPRNFYKSYLKDYHSIKVNYLKGLIVNFDQYVEDFFGQNVSDEDKRNILLTLKIELRTNYYHAIETFFSLYFALLPDGDPGNEDEHILKALTNSNYTREYKLIRDIADGVDNLDIINKTISFNGHSITVGHYLFYPAFLSREKLQDDFFSQIKESIDGIKLAIQIIAKEYAERSDYVSYKHANRAIPSITKIGFLDDNKKLIADFDLSSSVTYYHRDKPEEYESKTTTSQLDYQRDSKMANLVSWLIHCMIYHRRVSMNLKGDKFDKIPVVFFSKEKVKEASKRFVSAGKITQTITRNS